MSRAIIAAPVIIALLACGSGSERSGEEAPREQSKPVSCVIQIPGQPGDDVPGLPTKEGFDEFSTVVVNDTSGSARLAVFSAGGGKWIPSGTRCSFIDVGIASTRARMVDGSFSGQAFWFPTEWTRGAK